jgi:hypothetical protein
MSVCNLEPEHRDADPGQESTHPGGTDPHVGPPSISTFRLLAIASNFQNWTGREVLRIDFKLYEQKKAAWISLLLVSIIALLPWLRSIYEVIPVPAHAQSAQLVNHQPTVPHSVYSYHT